MAKAIDPFESLLDSKKSIEDLQKQFDDSNKKGGFTQDDRFWYPEVDKAGNGYGIIRFLPPPPDGNGGIEKNRWVKVFHHGFKGPGGQWYIEDSLTTINLPDPVSEYNSQLWNSGVEANKKQASAQKRKLRFISNVLVITDPTRPENNGKVKLFRYGKKIYEKLNDSAFPTVPGDESVDPFDMLNGANFKLVVRKVEGFPNYDKSTFAAPTPIASDKAAMKAIWEQEYSLDEFLNPKNFKSYDELKSKFYRVIGGTAPATQDRSAAEDTPPWDEPKAAPAKAAPAAPTALTAADNDDDNLAFFNQLAED